METQGVQPGDDVWVGGDATPVAVSATKSPRPPWPRLAVWLTVVSTIAVTALVARWMYAESRLMPWTEFDPENPPLRFYVMLLWLLTFIVNIRIGVEQERCPVGVVACTLWSIVLLCAANAAVEGHLPARARFSFEKPSLTPHVERLMAGPENASAAVECTVLGWRCDGAEREGGNVEFITDCRMSDPNVPYYIILIWSPTGDPGMRKGRGPPFSIGGGWYVVHDHS